VPKFVRLLRDLLRGASQYYGSGGLADQLHAQRQLGKHLNGGLSELAVAIGNVQPHRYSEQATSGKNTRIP
jgi:hypothetical protein